MIYRDCYKDLLKWKKSNESDNASKALLVAGARQVGKTYLIKQFAKSEYKEHVYFDLLEETTARESFEGAKSAKEAIDLVALRLGHKFGAKKTLVVLDEVQAAKNVVTLSKYLVQDGRFDVILSGSMLGVELASVKSFPVGYLTVLNMYPVSFLEFCKFSGLPTSMLESIQESYENKSPVSEAYHAQMLSLFRRYIVLGGMPDVVVHSIKDKREFGEMRSMNIDLVNFYREDIAKYSKDRKLAIKKIYEEMPSQLDKENKRFEFQSLGEGAKFSKYEFDFEWLINANVALQAKKVSEPKMMLRRTATYNRFKLYFSDVGMLMSQYPAEASMQVLSGNKSVNFGQVYENFFAQELTSQGSSLWYYNNRKKGEVDFLLETYKGKVLPVEIKSGKGYKIHLALNNLLRSEEYDITEAIVLSEDNISVADINDKKIYYLPIYMAPFVASETAQIPEELSFTFEPLSFE